MAGKRNIVQDELEIEKMADMELIKLQRQYRIMEGDREAFSEETGTKLRKQRNVIKGLKHDREDLMTDLKVVHSRTNRKNDRATTEHLKDLLEQHDVYEGELKSEKAHLIEIDYQIRKLEKEVYQLKSKQVTDKQLQQRVITAQKVLAQLEDRLDVAVKKFNLVLVDNNKLREEIDHLLRERADFNVLWQKLVGNLNRGKKFMLDLIEQASLAYDQREEWCSKLQALKERGKNDLMFHTQEMREMQRRLDHDAKLQEFLGVKGQRRLMTELEQREALKRKQQREDMERKLAQYREILDNIKEFSGEEDIDRLAAQFVKQEEENFALFNYVNELNHELEILNDAVNELRKKIDDQKALNEKRYQQQQDTIASLEAKLKEHTEEKNTTETALRQSNENMTKLLQGVEKMFTLVKCKNAPILELLGENKNVTQYNVHLYLGILEKRTNDLINMVYYKEKIVDKKKQRNMTIKDDDRLRIKKSEVEKLVPTQPCPLCVEQEQVRDVCEEAQEPLDREGIRIKLANRMLLSGIAEQLHNVSACHLPKSRRIMQMRYQ